MFSPLSLLIGWLLDLCLGDPRRLPHPIVWFGRMIAFGERRLNRGRHRRAKGAAMAVGLILSIFALASGIRYGLSLLPRIDMDSLGLSLLPASVPIRVNPWLILFDAVAIFYCLAGTTLIREVRAVFLALDRSLEEGRAQVSRIVGRDTSQLSAQEVRTAALETLAENLSDGVIAPLFWLLLLGTPGMLAYKMVNTLDSMIGYRTDRYRDFGCWAARLDDAANYLPARLTALLMVIASGFSGYSGLSGSSGYSGLPRRLAFARRYARCHASPNSGYPEAALAGILDCRFGGPHLYFGQLFDKPYIGSNDRPLTTADMLLAVRINRTAELMMVVMMVILSLLDYRCLLTVFL